MKTWRFVTSKLGRFSPNDDKKHLSLQKIYPQTYTERYLGVYSTGAANPIYTSAGMSFSNFTLDMRKKTAIYYDPRDFEVPQTYKTMKQYLDDDKTDGYMDFSSMNLFNVEALEESFKESLKDNVFLNIGLNITDFLSESPHNIF